MQTSGYRRRAAYRSVVPIAALALQLISCGAGNAQESTSQSALPRYALFGAPMGQIRRMMGEPTRDVVTDIKGTSMNYEWAYYAKRDLVFESIADHMFSVELGRSSGATVGGIGVGDDEAKVCRLFPKAGVQKEDLLFTPEFPLVLRQGPDRALRVAAEVTKATSARWKHKDFAVLEASGDGSWVKVRKVEWGGEKEADGAGEALSGWMPAADTGIGSEVRDRYTEYSVTVSGVKATYRVRRGHVTMISLRKRSAAPDIGGLLFFELAPQFDIEHVGER